MCSCRCTIHKTFGWHEYWIQAHCILTTPPGSWQRQISLSRGQNMHKSICKAQSTQLPSDMHRNIKDRQLPAQSSSILKHTLPWCWRKKAFDLKELEALYSQMWINIAWKQPCKPFLFFLRSYPQQWFGNRVCSQFVIQTHPAIKRTVEHALFPTLMISRCVSLGKLLTTAVSVVSLCVIPPLVNHVFPDCRDFLCYHTTNGINSPSAAR